MFVDSTCLHCFVIIIVEVAVFDLSMWKNPTPKSYIVRRNIETKSLLQILSICDPSSGDKMELCFV